METNIFIEFIVNLANKLRESEIKKQKVNDYLDFEPYSLFTRINRSASSFLTFEELINFLDEYDYLGKQIEKGLGLLIKHFDHDKDGKLSYVE